MHKAILIIFVSRQRWLVAQLIFDEFEFNAKKL